MGGIRVTAGALKGRLIPFDNRKFDDADITPQKVKGAIFSMIGEWLNGKGFLDLFAGSGQIGIEALSRGADPVVFNDTDYKRVQFMKACLDGFGLEKVPLVLNLSADRALAFLKSRGHTFDYIFLDPPYVKAREGVSYHRELVKAIADSGVLSEKGEIIIQHFSGNTMDGGIGPYHHKATKVYGKTALTVYSPH
ncbi:MAG TPA: RsmD family RNA methyltransferase [Spirochaetota bacterium]|nr:RsmD family RNA methyltransferase [Spirochaetota bacterium]HPC41725.1 RsmD family RNA methyltransferase [Spirochaetota bacterium]HQF06676.1 RsmD family RNA methyltransferase [Spirochaetota bacterium]HQH95921.1 RsmD family RNA methyltransferase [Spirochaetota bacterium]HQJ70239.1 RsmD family RNA methyltransferase [Spirochaetota bacterium]